ncbi:MAG: hypothetical protein A2Y12_09420 [Planctomycetes bacterium GWF2_42_9]|nr:MAG: hypothetical protein A2Y12_09420 [Planctomycetes bacterium GWF2_42_9]
MKKTVTVLVAVACLSSIVLADMVTIVPPQTSPGKIGDLCQVQYGWRPYSSVHTGSYPGTELMQIGDVYAGWAANVSVVKFDLGSAGIDSSKTISSALFKGYMYSSAGGTWIKIQKYTANNSTDLSGDDMTASVEDVAIVYGIRDGNFSYDLTSAVAADAAAGKTYSSFRLSIVKDETGFPWDSWVGAPEYYYSAIFDGWGEAQYLPRLEVTYVPEPATMALLLIGGAFLRKRV